MTKKSRNLTFFLLIVSFLIVAIGAWYMTGISARYFALATRDHFLAFFKGIINFFNFF
ncbi:MAG: hypothetical protein AAE975_05545 [Thermoplasmatales archaeon]